MDILKDKMVSLSLMSRNRSKKYDAILLESLSDIFNYCGLSAFPDFKSIANGNYILLWKIKEIFKIDPPIDLILKETIPQLNNDLVSKIKEIAKNGKITWKVLSNLINISGDYPENLEINILNFMPDPQAFYSLPIIEEKKEETDFESHIKIVSSEEHPHVINLRVPVSKKEFASNIVLSPCSPTNKDSKEKVISQENTPSPIIIEQKLCNDSKSPSPINLTNEKEGIKLESSINGKLSPPNDNPFSNRLDSEGEGAEESDQQEEIEF